LAFGKLLKERGIKKEITLAEAHRLPWGCRLVRLGTVHIVVWAVKLLLATLPAKNIERVIEDVKEMYLIVAVAPISSYITS